ncbi:hypothetical protein [Microbulbifer magnicolonia]|uniref:hypothetical protein n=1 Tax=Microbulbifer magnicolonia TaxID=3109744 RepID=UPI002B40F91B|nr:hypothetical protein [Microbulbifer sp. GG15]
MAASSRVLVLNSGSSSLKFALLDPHCGEKYMSGIGKAPGSPGPLLPCKSPGQKRSAALGSDAAHAVVIERFAHSVLIDQNVIDAIAESAAQAPDTQYLIAAIGLRDLRGRTRDDDRQLRSQGGDRRH